jgi:hypothetical protein
LEIPKGGMDSVVNAREVDVNNLLWRCRRSVGFGLCTVVLVVMEPAPEAVACNAGYWENGVNCLVGRESNGRLEGVCNVVPAGNITLDKLDTINSKGPWLSTAI